jgi:hypothetical protein
MAFRRALRLTLAALMLAPLVALAAATSAQADDSPSGAAVVQQCQDNVAANTPTGGTQVCRSAQAGEWGTAAACRTPLYAFQDATAPEKCSAIDGRPVSEAQVQDYETNSWVHRALGLQRALDAAAPLTEEEIPHTHNSFNSSAYKVPDPAAPNAGYYATLTNQDPNQAYSITDQLRMDIRAVEMDLHWVPSPWGTPDTGGYAVTDCHGTSEAVPGNQHVHVGCTIDRPFGATLDELASWLRANPNQFVLLYLENQLDGNNTAHTVAGQTLATHLGSLVYRPGGDGSIPCNAMPTSMSAADILATGAQVLIVGNCDGGNGLNTAWGEYVHSRGPKWNESGDPTNYGASNCTADLANHADGQFVRYYEEVTWLGTTGDTFPPVTGAAGHVTPITPDAVSQMVDCGANIIGLDQLTPTDPRLEAMVWSWAKDEPQADAGACAFQGGDARFHASQCGEPTRPFACLDSAGAWHETTVTGPWSDGFTECPLEFPGSSFAVPVNGWRNQQLASAKASAADEVWLNYGEVGANDWQTNPSYAAPARVVGPPLPQSGAATGKPLSRPTGPAAAPASPRTAASSPVDLRNARRVATGRNLATLALVLLVAAGLLAGVVTPRSRRY